MPDCERTLYARDWREKQVAMENSVESQEKALAFLLTPAYPTRDE